MLTKNFAGTERHVLELAAAQADAGHDVILVLRKKAARAEPNAIAHRVPANVRLVFVPDWIARWPAIPMARRALRKLSPDVVHVHLDMACRVAIGLEDIAPRVATLHLDYDPGHYDHLDGLVAIAPWQLEKVPARMRTVQIDNWTSARSAATDARQRLREQIGAGADDFVFGAVGRIVNSKGMDVLIDAFEQAALPNAKLVIVGQGRERERLAARAGRHVVMPGFSAHPENWMAAFDCFVSPAREEPFGLVLLEAMQAGLPIIATATAGARHLSDVMGTDLLAVGDTAALAQALTAMHASRPGRKDYDMSRFRVAEKVRELDAFYARLQEDRIGVNRRQPSSS